MRLTQTKEALDLAYVQIHGSMGFDQVASYYV